MIPISGDSHSFLSSYFPLLLSVFNNNNNRLKNLNRTIRITDHNRRLWFKFCYVLLLLLLHIICLSFNVAHGFDRHHHQTSKISKNMIQVRHHQQQQQQQQQQAKFASNSQPTNSEYIDRIGSMSFVTNLNHQHYRTRKMNKSIKTNKKMVTRKSNNLTTPPTTPPSSSSFSSSPSSTTIDQFIKMDHTNGNTLSTNIVKNFDYGKYFGMNPLPNHDNTTTEFGIEANPIPYKSILIDRIRHTNPFESKSDWMKRTTSIDLIGSTQNNYDLFDYSINDDEEDDDEMDDDLSDEDDDLEENENNDDDDDDDKNNDGKTNRIVYERVPSINNLVSVNHFVQPIESLSGDESIDTSSRSARYVVHDRHNISWPVKKVSEVSGDIILGGLMMVHEREDQKICGPIMPQGGIQALEAMLYTIDYINERDDILRGIKLGAYILDDCDKDTYGLEQSIDFIKGLRLVLFDLFSFFSFFEFTCKSLICSCLFLLATN